MSDMFKEFKRDLRIVRNYIELDEEYSFDNIISYLDDEIQKDIAYGIDPFNKKVLLHRIIDSNKEEPFTKQSLLRFLSEWEIYLA